jgi:hypothetical protein
MRQSGLHSALSSIQRACSFNGRSVRGNRHNCGDERHSAWLFLPRTAHRGYPQFTHDPQSRQNPKPQAGLHRRVPRSCPPFARGRWHFADTGGCPSDGLVTLGNSAERCSTRTEDPRRPRTDSYVLRILCDRDTVPRLGHQLEPSGGWCRMSWRPQPLGTPRVVSGRAPPSTRTPSKHSGIRSHLT